MSKLLNLGVVIGFLYVLMVITNYGYFAYFNIPPNYIDYSPQALIVFCFSFAQLLLNIVHASSWWSLGVISFFIGVAISILLITFAFNAIGRWLVTFLMVITIIAVIFGAFKLGLLLASETSYFYTAPIKCIPGATESMYIAPIIDGQEVVFVPINPDTHQLENGLLVRDMSSLTCQMEQQSVGTIPKS